MSADDFFRVPDFLSSRRMLCVQPHPDDMDIAAGGTLSRLAEGGTEISYLSITDDTAGFIEDFGKKGKSLGEKRKTRKKEQERAGEIIGVKDYYWIDFPDAGDWSIRRARDAVIKHIRMLRPDFIMTVDPWLPYEAHRDHIKCGLATSEAALLFNFPGIMTDKKTDKNFKPYELSGVVFCFSAKPNVVIDVGGYRDNKFKAIGEHESQFSAESLNRLKEYDDYRCRNLSIGRGFTHGEGFKVIHPDLLHIVPEAAL